MRIQGVLLVSAVSVAACSEGGPALRQPVGQTTVTSSSLSSRSATTAAKTAADASTGSCESAQLPTIEFASTSTALSEPQLAVVKGLAQCLASSADEKSSIVLIGHTDVVGTVPANLELGLVRAQAVMKELIDGGVSPGRIVVASAGELQRPSAQRGLSASRVEILVARGGPSRPNEAPITRGIDAEGLVPRPPMPAPTNTMPPRPTFVPRPPSGGVAPAPFPQPRRR